MLSSDQNALWVSLYKTHNLVWKIFLVLFYRKGDKQRGTERLKNVLMITKPGNFGAEILSKLARSHQHIPSNE